MNRIRLIKDLHRWLNKSWLQATLAVLTLDTKKLELLEALVRIAKIKSFRSFDIPGIYWPSKLRKNNNLEDDPITVELVTNRLNYFKNNKDQK